MLSVPTVRWKLWYWRLHVPADFCRTPDSLHFRAQAKAMRFFVLATWFFSWTSTEFQLFLGFFLNIISVIVHANADDSTIHEHSRCLFPELAAHWKATQQRTRMAILEDAPNAMGFSTARGQAQALQRPKMAISEPTEFAIGWESRNLWFSKIQLSAAKIYLKERILLAQFRRRCSLLWFHLLGLHGDG